MLIGIVGRLTEIKNHALFLRAAARLQEMVGAPGAAVISTSAPRVRFVIIGDGNLRPALEAQARQLGLVDEVVFLGSREDPENFYPALDIVALTSLNEGTPLTLIEAMANARPVIATAVGGVVDLVGAARSDGAEHGYTLCERGLLINSGDAEGLARGLFRLIGDESLARELGERARAYVIQNHAKRGCCATPYNFTNNC